jgi:hypothetical protein
MVAKGTEAPRGSGGPKGAHNGNYKHGPYTVEAVASS